jgi:excisionase family DNA binding protein
MKGTDQEERAALIAEGLWTIPEAVDFLRISRSRLYDLMNSGDLIFVKLGRSRRLPRRAVVDLATRGLCGGARVAD